MADGPTIIFIHLGSALPSWLTHALRQVRLFNKCRVVLAAEADALDHLRLRPELAIDTISIQSLGISEKQRAFRDISPLDRQFRDSFWTYTTERFFVLETIMRQLSLSEVVHLENDVMLYCDLADLVPKLRELYRGIAATFDNDRRCVPGFLYVPHSGSIGRLNDFIIARLQEIRLRQRGRTPIDVNDMSLLGHFRSQGPLAIDHLPIVPPDYAGILRSKLGHAAANPACYSKHFAMLQMIFDAAALGQYLGGVDFRSASCQGSGFINESCVFDPRAVQARLCLDAAGRRVPVIETAAGIFPVANLHIHSKALQLFSSATCEL